MEHSRDRDRVCGPYLYQSALTVSHFGFKKDCLFPVNIAGILMFSAVCGVGKTAFFIFLHPLFCCARDKDKGLRLFATVAAATPWQGQRQAKPLASNKSTVYRGKEVRSALAVRHCPLKRRKARKAKFFARKRMIPYIRKNVIRNCRIRRQKTNGKRHAEI